MSVTVKAIKFNHDSNNHSNDALNIRKNASTFVNVPEWQKGVTNSADQSPAAYAQKETQGHAVTIQASFQCDPQVEKAQVRAIDPSKTPPQYQGGGCGAWLVWLIKRLLWAAFGNVLGEVVEKWVNFDAAGNTGYVTLDLKDLRLWSVGAGYHITTWQWQYRLQDTDPWTDMDITSHKIYVLLEAPKSPWQQAPYNAGNTQLPWTDVMDYACIWAIGATDVDAAAGRVTKQVYAQGPALITYDCPGGGGSAYTAGNTFLCTQFLARLGGGAGLGQYVNCTDCATFVATFADILGCDLCEQVLGWDFDLNEMIAIGASGFSRPCGNPAVPGSGWEDFWYHEVAWKGSCSNDGYVFDGCLQVDGDANPAGGPPHTAELPVDMKHGAVGDLLYRDRLATPAEAHKCNPDCGYTSRRSVA